MAIGRCESGVESWIFEAEGYDNSKTIQRRIGETTLVKQAHIAQQRLCSTWTWLDKTFRVIIA